MFFAQHVLIKIQFVDMKLPSGIPQFLSEIEPCILITVEKPVVQLHRPFTKCFSSHFQSDKK